MNTILKRLFCAALCVALLCLPLSAAADGYPLPADKTLSAQSALVVYLGTNQEDDVLCFERDADKRLSPAGMARVVFGIYALEAMAKKGLDGDTATATFTEAMSDSISGTGLSVLEMSYGETWKLNDLLTICMIQTAADACMTLVSALAANPKEFVDGMNAVAQQEIGCTDTAFSNITGINDAGQYTTARDMYKIMRYMMLHYPQLQKMLSLSEYTATPVSGGNGDSSWPTTNELLRQSSINFYSPAQFGKTGYTDAAGYCLASVAAADNYQYMTIVMGSREAAVPEDDADEPGLPEEETETEGPHFADSKMLYRWVFNQFNAKTLVSSGQPVGRIALTCAWGTDSMPLVAGRDFVCLVEDGVDTANLRYNLKLNTETAEAPVESGQVFGVVEVSTADGIRLGEVTAVAGEPINRSQIAALWGGVLVVITSPWLWGVFGLLLLAVIAFLLLNMAYNSDRRKKKRRKVKKYK